MDYDENGVDRTLIRAYLRLSPLECLQLLEETHQLAESVTRDGEPPDAVRSGTQGQPA